MNALAAKATLGEARPRNRMSETAHARTTVKCRDFDSMSSLSDVLQCRPEQNFETVSIEPLAVILLRSRLLATQVQFPKWQ
jgi:hypothetical protein